MTSLFAMVNDTAAQADPTLDDALTPEGVAITMECELAHAEAAEQQIALLMETRRLIAATDEVSDGMLATIRTQVATAESLANEHARPRIKQMVMESLHKSKADNKVMAMENLGLAMSVLIPVLLGVGAVIAYRQAKETQNSLDALNKDLAAADDFLKQVRDDMRKHGVDERVLSKALDSSFKDLVSGFEAGSGDAALEGLLRGFKGKEASDFSVSTIRTAIKEAEPLLRAVKMITDLTDGFYTLMLSAARDLKDGKEVQDQVTRLNELFVTVSGSVIDMLCGAPQSLRDYGDVAELLDTGMPTHVYSAIPFAGAVGVTRRSETDPTLISRSLGATDGEGARLNKDVVQGAMAVSKDIQVVSKIIKDINAAEAQRVNVCNRHEKALSNLLNSLGQQTDETTARQVTALRRSMTRMGSVFKFVNECTTTYDHYMAKSASVLRRLVHAHHKAAKKAVSDVKAKA